MKKVKALIIVLVLGLAGMIYAAGNIQPTTQTPDKGKAPSCCCMSADSCNMKAHEAEGSQTAMKCCEMGKSEKGCCASMAGRNESSGKPHDCSCCKAHHDGNKNDDKQSCQMSKDDGAGCCAGCENCCQDEACCKAKTAKR